MIPLIAAAVSSLAPQILEGVVGQVTQKTAGPAQATNQSKGGMDLGQLLGSVVSGVFGGLGKK
jgi:hypothetical protein